MTYPLVVHVLLLVSLAHLVDRRAILRRLHVDVCLSGSVVFYVSTSLCELKTVGVNLSLVS